MVKKPAKKYTNEWYREKKQKELELRDKLYKTTKQRKGESASEWLHRINVLYALKKKKL